MIIDRLDKTIQIKIVYFGPALSGKTTTLKALFKCFGKEDKLKSIESSIGRTLFFDYGTIMFENSQWKLKIHIYSTTGQDFYMVTRPITLRGIDGIIFVADSQKFVYERNLASWNELRSYFGETFKEIPVMLCFNKQDLIDKLSSKDFLEEIKFFSFKNVGTWSTIALNGNGVLESFEEILTLIFKTKTPYLLEKCMV